MASSALLTILEQAANEMQKTMDEFWTCPETMPNMLGFTDY